MGIISQICNLFTHDKESVTSQFINHHGTNLEYLTNIVFLFVDS